MQLSRAYAILSASGYGETAYNGSARQHGSPVEETHALLVGLKTRATSRAAEGTEGAKKACGGMGYLAISGVPEIVQSATALCNPRRREFSPLASAHPVSGKMGYKIGGTWLAEGSAIAY